MNKPTPEQWALVLDYDRLLWQWAFEATPKGLNHAHQCISESYDIILMQAIRASMSYRPELGYTFGTYLGTHVKKLVYRHWVKRARPTNNPASLNRLLRKDRKDEFINSFAFEDRDLKLTAERLDIAHALECLPKRQQNIIKLWAGIGCRQLSEEQIGKRFRITRGRVWQLKVKALKKLKSNLTKVNDDY